MSSFTARGSLSCKKSTYERPKVQLLSGPQLGRKSTMKDVKGDVWNELSSLRASEKTHEKNHDQTHKHNKWFDRIKIQKTANIHNTPTDERKHPFVVVVCCSLIRVNPCSLQNHSANRCHLNSIQTAFRIEHLLTTWIAYET